MVFHRCGRSLLLWEAKDGGHWAQEAKLTPPDDSNAEEFGHSVSIKGTSIVVGDEYYDDSTVREDKGAVFVYEFDALSTSWKPVGGPLMNDDCNGKFGRIVRLTEDGELLGIRAS